MMNNRWEACVTVFSLFAALTDHAVCACTNLQVQVHQVALVEKVDSLQGLPDQPGDLGFWQQFVRHTVVKYLSTCRTGQRETRRDTQSTHKLSLRQTVG